MKKLVGLLVAIIVMTPTGAVALPAVELDNVAACTTMRRGYADFSHVTYYIKTGNGFNNAVWGFYSWNSVTLVKAYKLSNGKLKTSIKKTQSAYMKMQTEFLAGTLKTENTQSLNNTIRLCEGIGN